MNARDFSVLYPKHTGQVGLIGTVVLIGLPTCDLPDENTITATKIEYASLNGHIQPA